MTPLAVSIVMEWENVRFSADDRVGQVLAALAKQTNELAAAVRAGEFPFIVLPVELLVLYDPQVTDARAVERAVQGLRVSCEALAVQTIPAEGLDYFGMKNEGARRARGDVVIYLDSDVIPQSGWLATLVGSFTDPSVSVVASRAFVRPHSLYSRTVALTWFFDLPPARQELRPAEQFHANGAAFRRAVLLAHPYPQTPGQSRGAGWDLFLELAAAGISVHEHTGALVDHPPPQGLWHYCRRAIIHGSDDRLSICRRRGPRGGRLGRSIERTGKKWLRAISTLWHRGWQVGLSVMTLPAAAALVTLYFGCYFAGDLLSRRHPIAAQDKSSDRGDILPFEGPSQQNSTPSASADRKRRAA